jgi:hypothetical protein
MEEFGMPTIRERSDDSYQLLECAVCVLLVVPPEFTENLKSTGLTQNLGQL